MRRLILPENSQVRMISLPHSTDVQMCVDEAFVVRVHSIAVSLSINIWLIKGKWGEFFQFVQGTSAACVGNGLLMLCLLMGTFWGILWFSCALLLGYQCCLFSSVKVNNSELGGWCLEERCCCPCVGSWELLITQLPSLDTKLLESLGSLERLCITVSGF